MPVVARFDGITIRLFYNDHPPPHVHVQHGDDRAILTVENATLLAGSLPLPILRRATEWIQTNRVALGLAWQRARSGEPVGEV